MVGTVSCNALYVVSNPELSNVRDIMTKNTYNIAILTISDMGARGDRVDTSGDIISDLIAEEGYKQICRDIVPDEADLISNKLRVWCDDGDVDLVLTTGGTGLGPRDVTPEATRSIIQIEVPGITEAIRVKTLKNTQFSMLSRSVAGVRSGCLIINFPGSPKAVRECMQVVMPVIPHALEMIKGWRSHPGI